MTSKRLASVVRHGTTSVLALVLAACLQADQSLPFDVDDSLPVARSIGPGGGVLSLASGLSLIVPPGALATSTQIGATARAGSFSDAAGFVVPGTAYDLTPAGLSFKVPARLQLRLVNPGLAASDLLRLGLARETGGAAPRLEGGSFDITSGILAADIMGLGGVAAVVAADAIPLETGQPPTLEGGNLGEGPSGVSGAGGEPSAAAGSGFSAFCEPSGRPCFASGLVQLWMSQELKDRLGGDVTLLTPTVSAELTFEGIGASGQPTLVTGSVSVQGSLRARVGQSITHYPVDEAFVTGDGTGGATPTSMRVTGNTVVLAQTTDGANRTFEYGLRRVGSGQMLVVRMEHDVELENADGSKTTGTVILHVRLRR